MSKLFNTLRDVLTPYANKINLHSEEIDNLDDDVNDLNSTITKQFEAIGAFEKSSVGYGVADFNVMLLGTRRQNGIYATSTTTITTKTIIPVQPSTKYSISIVGATLTGGIRYYYYTSASESDFSFTGTVLPDADGSFTITTSDTTYGLSFQTSLIANNGKLCRCVIYDQKESLYSVITKTFSVITSSFGVAFKNGNYIKTDGSTGGSLSYAITDYIPVVNGDSIIINGCWAGTSSLLYAFYNDEKTYIQGAGNTSGEIIVTTIPTNAKYVRISSRISNGETPYAYVFNVNIIRKATKPKILINPISSTQFNVDVLNIGTGNYITHKFRKEKYTDTLTYGDDQSKTVVTEDVWYEYAINDGDDIIIQGNTNFIQALNIPGHEGHVGAGHGCVVADWNLFFADGKQFDPSELTLPLECSVFRFVEKASHYLRDDTNSPSSEHSYPVLDSSGNPIIVSIQYLDGKWEANNKTILRNRLDIVYDTPFSFRQAHAGMCAGYYPYFNNVQINNDEYIWNAYTGEIGSITPSSPSGGTVLPNRTSSVLGDTVTMFGNKYFIKKRLIQNNPENYSKTNMLITATPNSNNRVKVYLMPCVCEESVGGSSAETFSNGDVLDAMIISEINSI